MNIKELREYGVAWCNEAQFEELLNRVEKLEAALRYADEGMEEMICYVDDYFRKKWKLDEYITRTKAVLTESEKNDPT